MSLSWNESVRIGLCPETVVLARYGRGLRPRLIDKGILQVEAAAARETWRAPLAVLSKHLQNPPRPADATVVLSNHFVRYMLLESKDISGNKDEWPVYAAHHFEKTYGARATEWDIQVSAAGAGSTRLASAIDKTLLEEINAAFKNCNLRLRSIEPYLMTAYNRTLQAVPDSSFWFVLQEPGRMLLGLIRDGVWRGIRSRQANANWNEELRDAIERESAMLAPEERCPRVIVSAMDPLGAPAADGYQFTSLVGPASEDRHYAMVCI